VASLKALLESAEPSLKCVASLTAYVISAGSFEHRQAVIDGDLVPLLVDVAASGETELELKEMAARTVGNIAGGVQQQTEYVVECGGIQPLCDLLQASTEDLMGLQSTLLVLYKTLRAGRQKQANEGLPDNPYCTLLEQAGGVDKIVELQAHNDVAIAVRALAILATYLPNRVDAQRLEALVEAGVIQVVPQPGGGEDDRATNAGDNSGSESDSHSDGEGERDVDGQPQADGEEEEG